MRSPSEDLFRLIKAMSKSEKRNFKLQAGMMSGDKNYLELFNLIDRQSTYDEPKVVKSLKSEPTKGQFSVAKNYLYRLLLKSLTYNNSGKATILQQWREQIRILLDKDLVRQAGKLLRKALKEAEKDEDFHVWYELLDIKQEILGKTKHSPSDNLEFEALKKEQNKVLEKLSNLSEYRHLHQQVTLLRQTRNLARTSEDKLRLKELGGAEILKNQNLALSVRARLEFLTIHRKIHSYSNRVNEALEVCKELLLEFENHPLLQSRYFDRYLQELSNLCTYYFRAGEYGKTYKVLEKLGMLRTENPHSRVEIFQGYYILGVAFAVHVGDPERGRKLVPEIEKELHELGDRIPLNHAMWLKYLLAYLFLMAGQPELAHKWINRFFDLPKTELRQDLQGFARLLNLMIQFDLGQYISLEQETVKAQRFLEKNQLEHAYETEVLKTLRLLARRVGTSSINEALQSSYNHFSDVLSGEFSPAVHDTLDFELWLKSHCEGRLLADLRREKSNFELTH